LYKISDAIAGVDTRSLAGVVHQEPCCSGWQRDELVRVNGGKAEEAEPISEPNEATSRRWWWQV